MAESYAHWWRDAGLHSATSEAAHGWMTAAAPADAAQALSEQPAPRPQAAQPASPAPVRRAHSGAMPHDLPAFLTWLAEDPAQPEARWEGPLFLPSSQTDAPLLILCDMPEDSAQDPALPFAAPSARFIAAMLAAIGLTIEQAAFAPLCIRRPPGGLADADSFEAVSGRMRHYLALARPRAALILGDRTSRALGAAQGGRLGEISHAGGALPAAALAGPDLLMRRPMAKAASWQTLRLLGGMVAA